MFPELNTVFSVSSVLMLAILNKDEAHSINGTLDHFDKQAESHNVAVQKDVKYFNPHPDIVASGLCSYKYFINKVENRIPGI